ncbi:hypothetical protein [Bradyrhizobium sp. LHD-71]|uniref:hypothetical protein n=1 Tax=Bradyrhizobium sp. LHD-71 TaxID=3072141 RepID=UPI00281033E6|nr:hypothetical protein [Bradyrhizobium sp. LHD-71]MDQ8730506.1 hypothetical protein [Bradyrhizobium sp. LHD-71]
MPALVLPTTSMPGQKPQESGGRLINCFAESLGEAGPNAFKLVRCPGLSPFGTTNEENFRGGIQLGSLIYTAWSGKVSAHTAAGGAGSDLSGALTGSDPVFFARNNRTTPDLVIVSPDSGAFVATASAVSTYPDADVGAPNSVCFLKGYFIFGYGNGAMRASGLNSTAINTLDTATAESRPDTLYRVLARGDTLIAAGSASIEFWGINGEATGFPFSPITTHDRGIVGPYAIGGHEEGFGYGIFFIADDFTVRQLDGYASTKISPPDLDRLIEAVTNKDTLQISVYVTQGHPFVVVQCDDWTWEYDVVLQRWHERQSYNRSGWRGSLLFKGFDHWLCGDAKSGNIYKVDSAAHREAGEPLIAEIETGPQGSFPYGLRINRLDLFVTAAVGIAPGADPIETDPRVSIAISRDLGISWSNEWLREIGPQGSSPNVRVNNLGLVKAKGAKFKIRFSDPVHFALVGGDFEAVPLRN